MKLLIALGLFALSASSTENKHPIYEQILRNRPSINKTYAMNLSNVIHSVSVKYSIPKHIYTAILMQESNYRLGSVRTIKGYYQGKVVEVQTDFGISQIYWRNVQKLNLDIDKLTSDLVYSVEAGAKILAGFKRYSKEDENWWTRYNCGTRGSTNRYTCQRYKTKVERYL